MIKPLSKGKSIEAYEKDNPADDHAIGCVNVAQEALRYTLEQMIELEEEECPHPPVNGLPRRKYNICWDELKERAEEGK
ncbi:hypothetical protein LCGC14_1716070 [marine sediment metagenome]|uniref:Uncharacterized protein n=1 Tax=marine sediment metagenome TaxID=412755 RepID=A0A0F9JU84_9ZZZZ